MQNHAIRKSVRPSTVVSVQDCDERNVLLMMKNQNKQER